MQGDAVSASMIMKTAWASTLHRMDAWGLTLIIGMLAVYIHNAFTVDAAILLATLCFAYYFGYTVNDYFDAPHDALDEQGAHRNFFVSVFVPQRLAIAGFITSCALLLLGFGYFGVSGILLFLLSLFIIWSYSAPPIILKSRPGLDLLTHAVFVQTFPYVVCVLLLDLTWRTTDTYIVVINLLSSASGQLAQQLRDYEVDLKTSSTFTTAFGLALSRQCLAAMSISLAVVILAGFVLGHLPIVLLPVILIAAPVFYLRAKGQGATSRRYATVATSLALAYFVLLLLWRIYYVETSLDIWPG
jgi:4-hydroxybenzoate polyprenyltransferase